MRLLVFTYAPAGLGHLRVTDALVDSKPGKSFYELLGSSDPLIVSLHRVTSVNPFAKKLFEVSQYGILEDILTGVYVWYLRKTSKNAYHQLLIMIREREEITGVTIVATHFALAHQMAQIKKDIKKRTGIDVAVVVQVTDDTSQHIWCVKGADLTLVPSEMTRKNLSEYARGKGMRFNCEVSPYPVTPALAEKSPSKLESRWQALSKGSDSPINVIIPISGAAVGLGYLSKLLLEMDRISSRFHFWIVAKRSVNTRSFLSQMGKLRWVQLVTGRSDNEVVNLYESVYRENLIHLEITKPSEQSFKALIPPDMIGGSILLFTEPVGRQEWENIAFLRRHGLLLEASDHWDVDKIGSPPRALRMPKNPIEAARFIHGCLDKNLFDKMTRKFKYSPDSLMTGEISPRGAWLFWEKLKILRMV